MNQAIHRLRLFFCFFSGEDDFIIRKCNARIQIRFALIGLFVLFVFACCWLSAALFMSHVFDGARWISVPVGIIWALLVTNLYLLLLYTISPALLPVAQKKKIIQLGKKKNVAEGNRKGNSYFLNFSFLLRIALIIFLAIIIAQPINVWLFSHNYEEGDRFAATIKIILSNNYLSWMLTFLACCVMLLPVYFKYGIRKISEKNFKDDFESTGTSKGLRHLREQLANTTDFENLSKQILSIDINSIRTSDFYFQKSLIEYRIIIEEYEQFKKEYAELLTKKNNHCNRICWEKLMPYLSKLEKTNPLQYKALVATLKNELQIQKHEFEKYEYWADPPFRTKRRQNSEQLLSEKDLLETIYPDTI